MSPTAPKMPLNQFWDIVTELAWGALLDFQAVREAFRTRVADVADREAFESTFHGLRVALANAIEKTERSTRTNCQCGDDSFNDLTSHVVGLGRAIYEAELADPSLAITRGRQGRFTESFAYIFNETA